MSTRLTGVAGAAGVAHDTTGSAAPAAGSASTAVGLAAPARPPGAGTGWAGRVPAPGAADRGVPTAGVEGPPMPASTSLNPLPATVAALRAAGCVFAEDEARLLIAEAGTPARLATL